ncbi:hypothetical protein [Wocania ichthyoenteri]|uniref:hypothetical protein n=1 Tax=Wocania ichthyoenteri TaxID=1230531 RepID=UPI00053E352D|nr:hypothetical protein [Wocania ichthyoenteri]
MSYLYKIITLSLFIYTIQLSAQTPQFDYTLTSDKLSVLEKTQLFSSTLIKVGNTLKWVQHVKGTNNTITYPITKIAGGWNMNSSTGNLSYTLYKEGFKTSFNLTRMEGGVLKAVMSIKQGQSPELLYTFNITNITYP